MRGRLFGLLLAILFVVCGLAANDALASPSQSRITAAIASGLQPVAAHAAGKRPVITHLSIRKGKPGATLTLTGRNFGRKRGKSVVLFGHYKALRYLRWSAKRVVCRVPVIAAGKAQVAVSAAAGVSSAATFAVQAMPIVLSKRTHVLSAATLDGAATTDGGVTYTFVNVGETRSLVPGDIIVGKNSPTLPSGLLRRVTQVSGGGATVTTVPATLGDVFTSAQFRHDEPLTQSDFTGSPRLAPGVCLLRSVVVRPKTRTITLQLKDAGITQTQGFSNDFGPITVSGSITLSVTVHVDGAVDLGGVKSFEATETSTIASDLKASVGSEIDFHPKLTLADWGLGQIAGFLVWVGPVPFYFQPQFSIFVGADGQCGADVTSAVHYDASGTLGLAYQRPNFSVVKHFTTHSSFTPPVLSASGSVKVYAGAELGLAVDDLAGPTARLDGYASLNADTNTVPWWTLKAGLEGSVGAQIGLKAGFIDWEAAWKSGKLSLAEWTIAHAETPAPAPSPTPTPTTPPTGLAIGDSCGGGIVAYILQPGDPGYVAGETHGLIAATADQSTGIAWWNGSFVDIGNTATALGAGTVNTDRIIAAQGATATDYAAGLARAYGGGAFTDWYLPSRDEMYKLHDLSLLGFGGFAPDLYWSSSEIQYNAAWAEDLVNGGPGLCVKSIICRVRAVRSF